MARNLQCNFTTFDFCFCPVLEDYKDSLQMQRKESYIYTLIKSIYNAILLSWRSWTVSHNLSDGLIVQVQYMCFLFWVAVGACWMQNIMVAGIAQRIVSALV